MRRRSNEGTIHPNYYKGEIVSWRGLASYLDPETGRQRRKSVSRRTREETEEALLTMIKTLPQGREKRPRTARPPRLPAAQHPDSLHALLIRWLEFKSVNIRPSTHRDYVQSLLPLLPLVGDRDLKKLTVLEVDKAVQALHQQKGARLAGRTLGRLRMALRQAVRWQLVSTNVAEPVQKLRVQRTETTIWTPEQVTRFLKVAKRHRLYPLFFLAITTGMRKGELMALHWQDIDLESGELSVRRNLVKNPTGQYEVGLPKTETGRRKILLSPDTISLLREHRKAEKRPGRSPRPTDFVFTAASGNHIQHRHLDRTYRELTRLAKLPRIRFHDLRHTAASLLIRQGVPAKVVADQLGHADASFTLKVYTHVFDDQRAAAALPLNDLLGRSAGRHSPVAIAKPSSKQELQRGLEALEGLYSSLGTFLAKAPEWAKSMVGEL